MEGCGIVLVNCFLLSFIEIEVFLMFISYGIQAGACEGSIRLTRWFLSKLIHFIKLLQCVFHCCC